jgi:hypothetical protein
MQLGRNNTQHNVLELLGDVPTDVQQAFVQRWLALVANVGCSALYVESRHYGILMNVRISGDHRGLQFDVHLFI